VSPAPVVIQEPVPVAVAGNGTAATSPAAPAVPPAPPVQPTQAVPPMPPAPVIPDFDPLLVAPGRLQQMPVGPPRIPPPHRPAPGPGQEKQASMGLLYIWILLFGFVGTQLAWTLRPFFGDPGRPFALFRKIEGTFYMDIIRTIAHLLTG
jgi:hypothetical protein